MHNNMVNMVNMANIPINIATSVVNIPDMLNIVFIATQVTYPCFIKQGKYTPRYNLQTSYKHLSSLKSHAA